MSLLKDRDGIHRGGRGSHGWIGLTEEGDGDGHDDKKENIADWEHLVSWVLAGLVGLASHVGLA